MQLLALFCFGLAFSERALRTMTVLIIFFLQSDLKAINFLSLLSDATLSGVVVEVQI